MPLQKDLDETYLKMSGLSQDIASLTPGEFDKAMKIRDKSKKVRDAALRNYINGRLGLLIDGTGKNYAKIAKQKKRLHEVGYDCFMIFVNITKSLINKFFEFIYIFNFNRETTCHFMTSTF